MPDPVAQFGIAGVVVAFMAIALKIVWEKYQTALADKDRITETVLPALTQATAAVSAATIAIDRVTVLYDHRAALPPGHGDGR